jgi:hypothetical protein
LFARSFEQYIGTKTGDEAILQKIAMMQRAEGAERYWTPESFKPVEKAWDDFLGGAWDAARARATGRATY